MCELGDFEAMVDHLYAALARLNGLLPDLPIESVVKMSPRLQSMGEAWGRSFGYGISDELNDFISAWMRRAENP